MYWAAHPHYLVIHDLNYSFNIHGPDDIQGFTPDGSICDGIEACSGSDRHDITDGHRLKKLG